MQYTPDFDLEEIESRLYGQIYHSAPEATQVSQSNNVSIPETPPVRQVKTYSIRNSDQSNNQRYWQASKEPITQITVTVSNDLKSIENNENTNRVTQPEPVKKNNSYNNIQQVVEPFIPIYDNIRPKRKERRNNKLSKFLKKNEKRRLNLSPDKGCSVCGFRPFCECVPPVNRTNYTCFDDNFTADSLLFVNNIFSYSLDQINDYELLPNPLSKLCVESTCCSDAVPSKVAITSEATVASEVTVAVNDITKDSVIILSDTDEDGDSVVILSKSPEPIYIIDSDSCEEVNDLLQTVQESVLNKNKLMIKDNVAEDEKIEAQCTEIISDDNVSDVNCNIKNGTKKSENVVTEIKSSIENGKIPKEKMDIVQVKQTQDPKVLTESERTEMLFTPDSSVNDFIEHDFSDLTSDHLQFNFNLHGSDLDLTEKEFLRPTPIDECHSLDVYESESSCSESVTSIKHNNTYNELSVNARIKEIFSEPDLKEFSEFITPDRENNKKRKKSDKKKDFNKVSTKASSSLETQKKSADKEKPNGKKSKDDSSVDKSKTEDHTEVDSSDGLENHPSNKVLAKNNRKKEKKIEKAQKRKLKKLEKLDTHRKNFDNFLKEIKQNDNINSVLSTDKEVNVEESTTITKKKFSFINAYEEHIQEKSNCDILLNVMNNEVENDTISKKVVDQSDKKSDTCKNAQNKHLVLNPFHDNKPKKTFQDFWTEDMDMFYGESWGQENYDLDKVINSMSADSAKWAINVEDKYYHRSPRKRAFCLRCKEHGHVKYDCMKKIEPIKCSTCGAKGHFHARCPNLRCTNCGFKGGYHTTTCAHCANYRKTQCSLCGMIGHPYKCCPDLWRRYHLTTSEDMTLKSSPLRMKNGSKQWCSACAQQGHLQHECKSTCSEYYPVLPHVISYDPLYNRDINIPTQDKIMSDPSIPQLNEIKLSKITSYQEAIKASNNRKYTHMLKELRRKCERGATHFLPQIKNLERDLKNNHFNSKKISSMWKLKYLVNKHF